MFCSVAFVHLWQDLTVTEPQTETVTPAEGSDDAALSTGAIVGIAIGCAAVAGLVAGLVVVSLGRNQQQAAGKSNGNVEMGQSQKNPMHQSEFGV